MDKTFKDFLFLLRQAEKKERQGKGLNEDEIYAIAYKLKNDTSDIFNEANFKYNGYVGIISPEVSKALGKFQKGKGEETDIGISNYFYCLEESDFVKEAAIQEVEENISDKTKQKVNKVIDDLLENKNKFLAEQNKKMRKEDLKQI